MLGPNVFADIVCLKSFGSSEMVNSEVGISKVSAIFYMGREILSWSFGSLPKRFPKCLAQLANIMDWDPPLRRMVGLERLPEVSEMVYQATWCCFDMCREAKLVILPSMKSALA